MKTWFNYIFMAGLALTTLASCEKNEERLTLAPTATAPALTSSATSVSLTSTNASSEALRLAWTPADYGYKAAVNYTVQLDKKGGTFEAPVNISAGTSTSISLSGADMNQNLLKVGLAPNNVSEVDVRVMANIARPGNDASNMVVSPATTISATPYLVVVSYPSIYVPGAYQDWAPDKAPGIASVKDNKIYEGYVYFKDASGFKFTPARNWDNDYGADGVGKLKAKGSDLSVPTAGYYLLKADLTALTYSVTKTDWAIIGAATPKGWDTETPMTFDPVTNTWQITQDLKADQFKFRANNAWDINFGDGDSKNKINADGFLDYNGDNLVVPAAGRYLITLNLSAAGNYIYTLTKQ